MYPNERPRQRSNFADVGRFHTRFGLRAVMDEAKDVGPGEVTVDMLRFRAMFLLEEVLEFIEACGMTLDWDFDEQSYHLIVPDEVSIDHAKAFDALIDETYVAMGTAHLLGYPWQAGWSQVHRANMAKVRARADGSNSLRQSSLDVIKPPGWTPPDIEGLLSRFEFINTRGDTE